MIVCKDELGKKIEFILNKCGNDTLNTRMRFSILRTIKFEDLLCGDRRLSTNNEAVDVMLDANFSGLSFTDVQLGCLIGKTDQQKHPYTQNSKLC